MNGYYTIFNPRGEKIADCGNEKDVINLMHMRNRRWEGHYYQFNPNSGEIIDIYSNQLPPNQKYIGWKEASENEFDEMFPSPITKKQIEQSTLEEVNLDSNV